MPQIDYDLDSIQSFGGSNFPEGKHRAKLIACEERNSGNSGNPTLYWEWEGADEESQNETIMSYSSLMENALGSPTGFKAHFEAFGYHGQISVDTDELIGRHVMLIVGMQKRRDRLTGEETERLSVLSILPDEKKAVRASTPARNGSSLSQRIGSVGSRPSPSARVGGVRPVKAEQDDLPF